MTEYIYFVKCPNCEDEHFDFFEDAKLFALGCLSKKPIITQVEVTRDDFGCCTDSCDLGTIWSYEQALGQDCSPCDDDSLDNLFSKSETFPISCSTDEDVTDVLSALISDEASAIKSYDQAADEISANSKIKDKDVMLQKFKHIRDEETEHINELSGLLNSATSEYEHKDSSETKIMPDNMTIEALVEQMEEFEDTVECKWCEDLFDKSECRYEVNLGWLCDRCQAAIMSRGESLTFKENSYWDFLEENDKLTEAHEFNNFSKLESNELTKAKSDILLDLYCDADASDFVNLQTESLSVPFIVDSYSSVTNKKSGTKRVGTIVDFDIVGNRVVFKLESGINLSLQDIFKAASKDSKTRKFLDAFEFVVKKINKASRIVPSVLFERDLIKELEKEPIFAETLAKYITDITFSVPLINVPPYDADFYNAVFADDVALDSDEGDAARRHIENLCDKFMSKPFARSAIEKNKVINRTIKNSDKSYHVNPKNWGNSANIFLSRPIKAIEAEAPGLKDLINNSKTIKDNSNTRDVQDSDTSIKNFNLASALIQYFDNDVEFYTKSRLPLTASLTQDKKVSELTESSNIFSDIVELEYDNFDDPYGPSTYTYEVERNAVIEYLYDYALDGLSEEEVQELLKLSKPSDECDDKEYYQAIDDNFDELFKRFEGDIYEYFKDACIEEYYSQDWETIAYEQAAEFQWECDNDK